MIEFKRTTDMSKANGTSLAFIGIDLSPKALIEMFGVPDMGDEFKVSGEYIFEGKNGEIFTLYDWKNTSMYDKEAPSPQALWQQDEVSFNIGCHPSHGDLLEDFMEFLKTSLENLVNSKKEMIEKAKIEQHNKNIREEA